MTTTTPGPSWTKPGPGSWELDSSHCRPAPGPVQRALYEEAIPAGTEDGFSRFGTPLQRMEMRWVHGRFYRRLVPLVGGDRDLPPPPAPVLWLATRLHPAFRRQERLARASFAGKRWRDEVAQWEREWKPQLLARNTALTDVAVEDLDDRALASHLTEVHDHLRTSVALHFRLHVADMGPLGDLMVHLEDWGLTHADAFRALVGASPATSQPRVHLRRVAAALRRAGTDPAAVASLDDVRSASDEAARELDGYLREHGWRLTTGYDLEDRCLIELPDVVLASIRAADGSPETDEGAAAGAALASLRADVPEEHRATFDEIAEDARSSYGLRDENGPLTYEWPAGLLRRAMLEAGRRLAARGAILEEAHAFELTVDELGSLLRKEGGPSAQAVVERAEHRRWEASLDPPDRLGPVDEPPPLWVMPPNLRRITRIVFTVVATLESTSQQPLTGTGVGAGSYVGTARVVRDPTDALGRLEPGDVVVAPYTAPTYNAVLAIAGAIVTEEGGLLCHAAVIARELGLPAVVGAADAMTRIPDGATVEVDATAGRVTVV